MAYAIMENPIQMEKLTAVRSELAEKEKQKHFDTYKSLPMPSERQEAWRYTSIEKLKIDNFAPFNNESVIECQNADEIRQSGIILTDINDAFESHPDLIKKYFSKLITPDSNKFAALNASHFANGIFLYVPKNAIAETPIKISFLINKNNSVIRNLIIAESGSKIDFIEEYVPDSDEEFFNSAVTEVYANDDSKINYNHLNNFGGKASSMINICGSAGRNASINWFSASFGGKLNRLVIDTLFNGEGSQSENLGLFVGKNREHIDITTNAYHNTPHTSNNIKVDGILKDNSSSVYRGLIRIEKEGQQTNSYLSNHILKIGEKTLGNSIPSLQIEANDVKASHGATVGQVSEEHLFYLMSRGLSRDDAESMITQGFLEPIICKIKLEELREKIRGLIIK